MDNIKDPSMENITEEIDDSVNNTPSDAGAITESNVPSDDNIITDAEAPNEEVPNEDAPTEDAPETGEATAEEIPQDSSSTADSSEESADNSKENTDSEEDELAKQATFQPKRYEDSYYLLYGKDKLSECLDLDGTKEFLTNLGFEGGELLQARREKEMAQAFQNKKDEDSDLVCCYCGLRITGVDYYRLRDGRYRCTQCSRSLVKTEEQLENIFKKIIKNMEILFDAIITTDIEIEMTDEVTIKKKCNLSIGDIDDTNIMIFGVAIRDKDGYRIYIDHSLPRIRAIATFVHELTHIWQYENWDKGIRPKPRKCIFKRKPKHGQLGTTRDLSDYEGMAKWAEIQYLYHIGETRVAEQEEYHTRKRIDEYGLGFVKYDRTYPLQKKIMTKGKTPFTTFAPKTESESEK